MSGGFIKFFCSLNFMQFRQKNLLLFNAWEAKNKSKFRSTLFFMFEILTESVSCNVVVISGVGNRD